MRYCLIPILSKDYLTLNKQLINVCLMEQGVARSYLFLLIKPSVIYLFFKSFLKLKRNEDSFIRERECMRKREKER